MTGTVDLSAASVGSALTGVERIPALQGGTYYAILASQLATLAQAGMAPLASPAFTGSPTAPTQAQGDSSTNLATTGFVMGQIGATTLDRLTAAAANYSMAGNRLTNLGNAVNAGDAVNLAQLQSYTQQGAHSWTEAACVATGNVSVTAAPATIDGHTPNAGDRILLTGQTTASQNGLWVYAGSGSAMTRPADFASAATIASGFYVFIGNGTTYGASGFILSAPASVTVDTTAATWTQFTGAGEIVAGSGLAKTGNTLAVNYGTAAGTVAVGNDSRITGALQKANALSELTASAATARTNIGAAASGANTDITSMTGLAGVVLAGANVPIYGNRQAQTSGVTINEMLRLSNGYVNGASNEPGITFTSDGNVSGNPLTDGSQTFALSASVSGTSYLRALYNNGGTLTELWRSTADGGLTVAGGITAGAAGGLNGNVNIVSINTNSGTAAGAVVQASNGTHVTDLVQLGENYPTIGFNIAASGGVQTTASHLVFATATGTGGGAIAFYDNNTQRMLIDGQGNIFFGAPSSTDPIGAKSAGMVYQPGNQTIDLYNTSGSPGIRVGLSAAGSIAAFFYQTTGVGGISVTSSATSFLTTSDHEIKTEVNDNVPTASSVILAIPSRYGYFNDAPDQRQFLFYAHEIQPHLPHIVFGEKDAVDAEGKRILQQVDYSKFAPLFLAGFHEVFNRLDALEKRLAA